ncbi:hypothetical protein NIES3974_30130 [Calothrix sp. NIES-3974]|nr:hypothetical protein NIES3974_30130 [Calothrix sp. NIES-3974]
MESLMQNVIERLTQNLLLPETWIYLIVKVGALLLVLSIWMLLRSRPAY